MKRLVAPRPPISARAPVTARSNQLVRRLPRITCRHTRSMTPTVRPFGTAAASGRPRARPSMRSTRGESHQAHRRGASFDMRPWLPIVCLRLLTLRPEREVITQHARRHDVRPRSRCSFVVPHGGRPSKNYSGSSRTLAGIGFRRLLGCGALRAGTQDALINRTMRALPLLAGPSRRSAVGACRQAGCRIGPRDHQRGELVLAWRSLSGSVGQLGGRYGMGAGDSGLGAAAVGGR